MTEQAASIYINGDGNVIGDGNFVTITKQYFTGEYERLGDVIIEPWSVFRRVELDRFVGREWLLNEIDAFLAKNDRGYLILEAEAGLGKTTFLAWLAKTRGYLQHFCELAPGRNSVETGLKNLTAQLVLACSLNASDIEGMLPTAAKRPDYFDRVLNMAAQSRKPGEKIIVVIDSLDAAETPDNQNTLALPTGLPKNVYILVSQRPTSATLLTKDAKTHREIIRFSERRAENLTDIRCFLAATTERPRVTQALQRDGCTTERFVETLLQKCNGVWIYLYFVIYEIEAGRRTLARLHSLPNGIIQYYADYWLRQRNSKIGTWDEVDLPVLGSLATASEAVSLDILIAWSNVPLLRRAEIGRRLNTDWRPFVAVTGQPDRELYQFYHATLREFFAREMEKTEWDRLTADEKGFVNELRNGTLSSLRRAFRTARRNEKAGYARLVVHWQGLGVAERYSELELLEILDLAAGFASTQSERDHLEEGIAEVLTSASTSLSLRQHIQLLVYQAGLLGNSRNISDAENSYRKAEELLGKLLSSASNEPEDLKLDARVKLGRAINMRDRAEQLPVDDPGDEDYRTECFAEARDLLRNAERSARTYGKDMILLAVVLKELCWTYSLLGDWDLAQKASEEALRVLNGVADQEARDSYRARVMETAGYMHWLRGEALSHDPSAALEEYRRALGLTEDELVILKESRPSALLTIAYTNWGEYRLAVDQFAGDPVPQHLRQVCEYWRAAVDMARMLGIPKQEKYATQLLKEHCSDSSSDLLPDA